MTSPDETPQILAAVAGRLDGTRDLLEVATTHLAALGERVSRHEHVFNDLHWDAARILTSDTPEAATSPAGRRALRAVQLGTEELTQDIQRSTGAADATRQLLENAGHELSIAGQLIVELNTVGPLPAETAVGVAVLAGRTERLSMLLEVASPLIERVQQQLGEARTLLEQQVSVSAKPDPRPVPTVLGPGRRDLRRLSRHRSSPQRHPRWIRAGRTRRPHRPGHLGAGPRPATPLRPAPTAQHRPHQAGRPVHLNHHETPSRQRASEPCR